MFLLLLSLFLVVFGELCQPPGFLTRIFVVFFFRFSSLALLRGDGPMMFLLPLLSILAPTSLANVFFIIPLALFNTVRDPSVWRESSFRFRSSPDLPFYDILRILQFSIISLESFGCVDFCS
jgi:hypothetical protein